MRIVPGRPTVDGLTWCLLADDAGAPVVSLVGPDSAQADLVVHRLSRLGLMEEGPIARAAYVVATRRLAADSPYTLTAQSASGATSSASSRTLPAARRAGEPYTLAVGSCFCPSQDAGLARIYPPPRHRAGSADPVRMRILCGDQIYMDLAHDTGKPLSFSRPDPWLRYPELWRSAAFGDFLSASPNLAMADDHEYWNDYPHGAAWLTWSESKPLGPFGRVCERAYEVFQVALNLDPAQIVDDPARIDALLADGARTFEVANGPLRLFLFDTRTGRTRFNDQVPRMAKPAWIDRVTRWLASLPGPGVLVVSQPMVEIPAGGFAKFTHTMGDVNLPDYERDFGGLWEAVQAAPHQVLIVSGDIHWSRVYRVVKAGAQRPVFEAISSPLARIPIGSASTGETAGKLEWLGPGGVADWLRLDATAAPATYMTVSITPTLDADASPLDVVVAAWVPRGAGPSIAAEPVYETRFQLT